MVRIKFRSVEAQARRRSFAKRMTIVVVLFLVLVSTGLIFLLRMEVIQIREANIEGTNIISKEEIQNVVNNSLAGNILWLIPKTNTLIYSVKDLNNALVQQFPGISTLNINRVGFKKISIKLEERKPQVLWCRGGEGENVPDCYFVDSVGMVFAKAPFFSGNVYFVYKGLLNKEDPLGAQILDSQDFLAFESFIKQISNKLDLQIVSVEIKDQGDLDLYLSSGLKIMLNKNISYDDMYNNIDVLLKSKELSSSTVNTLEYIDMRFGNKVYFKSKTTPAVTK
jgi:cell division septal protein FtsQ